MEECEKDMQEWKKKISAATTSISKLNRQINSKVSVRLAFVLIFIYIIYIYIHMYIYMYVYIYFLMKNHTFIEKMEGYTMRNAKMSPE